MLRVPRQLQELYKRSPYVLSHLSTGVDSHGDNLEVSEHIRKQILHAGLHYLADTDKLKENIKNRNTAVDIGRLVELSDAYKKLMATITDWRRQRNASSKHFSQLESEEERRAAIQSAAHIKQNIHKLEAERVEVENEMLPMLAQLPNTSHPDTPVGGYERCRLVHQDGRPPEFDFKARDHIELGTSLGLFDFKAAAEVSGNSYYYLEGPAALLEIALIQYATQKAVAKGFHPVSTPDVIKTDLVEGCGFHPRGPASQVYHVSPHSNGFSTQCLSGTAEIPLAGKLMKRVIPFDQLPLRMVAFGRCFRAETGGRGHYTRGLYRVHQFSKVELFGVTAQEEGLESARLLEDMLSLQKEIMSELGLPYRVLEMSTEELGSPAHRKFDVEVWMPGRGRYGEVTSASNCTDYQSRRLLITYPNPNKMADRERKRKYTHTVNATACAIPRILIALLENYQQQEGSVVLPGALRPFLPEHSWHIKPSC